MTANPSNNHTTMFKCKLYDRKNAITNVISNNETFLLFKKSFQETISFWLIEITVGVNLWSGGP